MAGQKTIRLGRAAVLLLALVWMQIAVAASTVLTVGLYPWVPRPQQFQQALTQAWQKLGTGVELKFASADEWDGGYDKNPSADLDVYVFDAMYLDLFKARGWLEPIAASEVSNPDDFVDYAKRGLREGDRFLALPLLGCTNVLFYRKGDQALEQARTLGEVQQALRSCSYTSPIPPDPRGLMIDLSSGITTANFYLDAQHDIDGRYPLPLPWSREQFAPPAMESVRTLLAMASYENATGKLKNSYQRGAWFDHYGRALVGYTETMSAMSPATRDAIGLKVMPLGNGLGQPLFYADAVAVNPATKQRALAVKLANLLAEHDTVVASIGQDAQNAYPQYLMAARSSVFSTLEKQFPIYRDMHKLITDNRPVLFKVNKFSKDWLGAMAPAIKRQVRADYACGCDARVQGVISDQTEAARVCPGLCSGSGGWNGQWSNRKPVEGAVCGCRSCPAGQTTAAGG